ncbi:MAG: DNA-directed RNA polymerase subunit alpha [Patescibacteria group bacterium]|nr:DNA-directed RNA polymerase subunit alpha [Patescibacteria group bacterium]
MIDSSIILPSKPRIVSEDQLKGIYEVDGLYPGYGHTLGNSLRRILLSSLVGTAITTVKVEGVTHEFATIPGVKEDVISLILNLKRVRFKFTGDEPQKLSLKVKGEKEITAKDIQVGGQVEVINSDQYLATITDKKGSLDVELTVERGMGYLPKEVIRHDRNEIGVIFLDAVFTPIHRASYEVENMRVGDRTDYNRLRLNIETDGTVSSRQALEKALEIMISQLQAIVGFKSEETEFNARDKVEAETEESEDGDDDTSDSLKTRVDELELSTRTSKALTSDGIRTVGGLVRKKGADLLKVEGLGEKGLTEIRDALSKLDLSLKDDS